MKKYLFMLLLFFVCLQGACAREEDTLLESVKFNLDRCNTANAATESYCSDAASQADQLVTLDPDNVEYAVVASNAHFANSGLDLLELTSELAGLTDSALSELSDLRSIACTFANLAPNLTELENSKTALTNLRTSLGATAFAAADNNAAFNLALIQTLDAYIFPSVQGADPGVTGDDCVNTAFDLTAIETLDETARARIEADLIGADNNFLDANVAGSDVLVSVLRDYWCRLSSQPNGFSVGVLKAFTYCQLIPDSDAADVQAILNLVNTIAELSDGEIATACLAFTEATLGGDFTTCKNRDTQ